MNNQVNKIYTSSFHTKYEKKQKHMTAIKKEAIINSGIKEGDSIALFGCGSGMEFKYIIDIIGESGSITGIDFSPQMLQIAQKKIDKNKWKNITLIEGDISSITIPEVDCVFCTLCISIIEEWELVLKNILKSVKVGGIIVMGDMQLAKGWKAIGNPISVALSKEFGGTYKGHRNTTLAIDLLKEYSEQLFLKKYLFDSYITIITRKMNSVEEQC